MNTIGALFYLVSRSWWNRTRLRIRRLRQPKYLIGAIFGGAYFYFYFYRFLLGAGLRGRGGAGGNPVLPAEAAFWLETAAAVALGAFVVMGWLFPSERAALVFTEPEVAFLFPAPLSRKKLLHFKLAKSQVAMLFGSIMLTLVTGRITQGGAVVYRVLGWWLAFSTLNLHLLGASFARTQLLDRGITPWRRRFLVLGVLGLLVGGIGLWAWRTIPAPPNLGESNQADFPALQYYARQLTQSGPVPYLLAPLRAVVHPYFSRTVGSFLWAALPVLAIMALHYLWVVRSNVAFEEASVEASRKMAERVAAMRSGQRGRPAGKRKKSRDPFQLAPTGWPAAAFLWKNLLAAGQGFTFRFWIALAIGVGSLGIGLAPLARSGHGLWMIIGPLSLGMLGFSVLAGPQLMRHDFRQDLPMADMLRTYPLPAWQLALGELLAPVVILTGLQWCLILLGGLTLPGGGSAGDRLAWTLAAGLILPGFNLVSLIIPNAAVLFFPGWFQTGPQAMAGGIEATGQRMVFMLGQLLVLIVSLVPAALLVAAVWFLGHWLGWSLLLILPLAAVVALILLLAEGALGLWWLGRLFQRYDLSGETIT